ncbi:MAG TPA: pitrilysin family protein, partial [Candidatus Polarisedimenticolia bacterium]|nr:pitrilysin family protein [Candidatus Polarisedimenticolia bacterium]
MTRRPRATIATLATTAAALLALAAAPAATASAPAGTTSAPAGTSSALAGTASSAPTDPRALRYPPLTMAFPAPGTTTLSNGLVVHLLPDHDLPIVDVAFFARGGSLYDPGEKAGLAILGMHAMRTGGTAALGPDDVDERLETLPAEIHLAADDDALTGSVSCLKDRFPEALQIFAGMLRQPRFDADRLESERGRVLESIRRRWDDPGSISHLLFARLVYGEDSPWARLPTAETIGRIQRDDLLAFQRAFLRPGNMRLAVSGDFEPKEMQRLLEKTLADWRGGKAELPAVPKVKARPLGGVYLVERPLTQSSIAVGHLGVARFDPDKFPLYVVNEVLGEGGFTSRLMKEVRSTRGLAYSVSGGVGSDTDRGLFEVRCRTRADATVQAIEAIREVIRGFREQGPTDAETQEAKDAQTNSFVFTVDGLDEYMQQFLYYEHYGYPPDYLRTWRDKLAAVTRADAARAAKSHLAPDGMVILVVGNPKAFDRPLDSLGLGAPKTIRLPEAGGLPQLS